jgi:hypothetical protein
VDYSSTNVFSYITVSSKWKEKVSLDSEINVKGVNPRVIQELLVRKICHNPAVCMRLAIPENQC